MKKIVINGANGYVASNFIIALLNKGYQVTALVRNGKTEDATQRMKSVLSEMKDEVFNEDSNLKVFNYSLTDENFGLSENQLKEVFNDDVDYFHFAASLKYNLKSRDEIFNTNINGVENSTRVFLNNAGKNSRFFFISTAYSCGITDNAFEERFYDNQEINHFRNYYEQSKRFAENKIKNHITESGLNAHIIRLSQVVGNSENGLTKTDYGIFDFSKRIASLAFRHPGNTIRIKVDGEATQNLIPINIVTDYLIQIQQTKNLPRIFNLVANHATKNNHILNILNTMLPVNLIAIEDLKKEDMSSLERIVDIGMSFTGKYTGTNLNFKTDNIKALYPLNKEEVNTDSLKRMIDYFITSTKNPEYINS